MEAGSRPPPADVELSVVVPARDEADNVGPLIRTIERALAPLGRSFEVIVVDDGSRDGTGAKLRQLMSQHPRLRCLALRPGTSGQSAALAAGYRAARGELVSSLDADLQNDPRDLVRLIEHLEASGADLVQGDRSAARRDGPIRRFGSLVGRLARRSVLRDRCRDTGCSLRVMRREVARALPLDLRGMHRFVPALTRQLDRRVEEVSVGHRQRRAGISKYGLGLRRALPGLIDLLAVRYMASRRCRVDWDELRA